MIQGKVDVSWETTAEEGTSHFEVEISKDGKEWITAGSVPSTNSYNLISRYSYAFKPNFNSDRYYVRVKQVDISGAYAFSAIIRIQNVGTDSSLVELFPNPSQGKDVFVKLSGQITNSKESILVQVFDQSGKQVFSGEIEKHEGELLLPKLQHGLYMLRAVNGDKVEIKRLLVN